MARLPQGLAGLSLGGLDLGLAPLQLLWLSLALAVLAILAAWFVAKFLPETKGLALEDVTAVFERQATGKESVA